MNRIIIEKRLGIPGDYQYKALRDGWFIQKNWHANKYLALATNLKISRNLSALNLGTGSGNFELLFSKSLKHITGVDYNDEALAFLKAKLTQGKINNVSLFQADIRSLPKSVLKKKYELVTIIDTLEHILISDAKKVIWQVSKMLKPGGQLLVITPNSGSAWPIIEWLLDRFKLVPKLSENQHLAKFTSHNLQKVFREYEITPKRAFTFNLFSFLWPGRTLSQKLLEVELKYLGGWGCLICVIGEKTKA